MKHDKAQPGTTPALSELKVVVHPEIPGDELWAHPSMFDLLRRAFLEADNRRGLIDWLAMQERANGT